MTSMPRAAGGPREHRHGVVPGKRLESVIRRSWHVACIAIGCTGCPYWGPITYIPDENVLPIIQSHTDGTQHCPEGDTALAAEDDVLCIAFDGQTVFVTATDADGDTLAFHWEGSATGRIGSAENTQDGDIYSSKIVVDRDTLVDGETLKCWISDGSSEFTSLEWKVVVYE